MGLSLSKGDKISLTKDGGAALEEVAIGLGWGTREVKKAGFFGIGARTEQVDVDLDASCILYDANKNVLDAIWFRNLRSSDGSVKHSGDDRSGGGGASAPNEVITVDLTRLSSKVASLVFVVNSFTGESFEGIPSAFCNVVDKKSRSGGEVARFNLQTAGGAYRGFIISKVYRDGATWKFQAIGEPVTGTQRTVQDIEPMARVHA
jgi:tellurium resistance protein TerZ